jgi:hypothetical protein
MHSAWAVIINTGFMAVEEAKKELSNAGSIPALPAVTKSMTIWK